MRNLSIGEALMFGYQRFLAEADRRPGEFDLAGVYPLFSGGPSDC